MTTNILYDQLLWTISWTIFRWILSVQSDKWGKKAIIQFVYKSKVSSIVQVRWGVPEATRSSLSWLNNS